jgi:hypothetical protein
MKVAQYEVLGIMQKETSVPQGTIEVSWLLVLPYAATPAYAAVDRPVRDGSFFELHPSTSCWATFNSPPGSVVSSLSVTVRAR